MTYELEYRSVAHAAASIAAHDEAIVSYNDTISKLRAQSAPDVQIANVERLLVDAQKERQRARNWHTAMRDRNVRGRVELDPSSGLRNGRAL